MGNFQNNINIIIPSIHPVQMSSFSDCCITTVIIYKYKHTPIGIEECIDNKIPEPDFSWTCYLGKVLDVLSLAQI